jgi:hypothetical protein
MPIQITDPFEQSFNMLAAGNLGYLQRPMVQQQFQERQADLAAKNLALQQTRQQQEDITGFRNLAATSPGADPDKQAYEYWKTRDPQRAEVYARNAIEKVKAAAANDQEGAVKYMNSFFGTDFKYSPKGEYWHERNPQTGQMESYKFNPKTGELTPVSVVGEAKGLKYSPEEETALQAEVEANKEKYPNVKAIPAKRKQEVLLGLKKAQAEATRKPADTEMAELNKTLKILAITKARETSPGVDITQPLASPADEAMAQQLAAGKLAPSQLSKRTTNFNAVVARATVVNPNLDLMAAESGFTAGKSPQIQKMSRSLDAVKESLDLVRQASKEFTRSDVNLLNNIILKGEVQFNDPRAIRFQTYVNGLIDDVASALSGGGATTDQARNQARTLFNTSYSQGGMDAAIGAVEDLITKRRTAFTKGTYLGKPTGIVPAVGEVRGGYRFKGGDPSKKENWEKQ